MNAQPYYFNHFRVENGLSNNTVLCSIQDRNGFLWFGSKAGLNRFDGYNFKVYSNESGFGDLLESNFVRALAESSDGLLWIGTDQGLYNFDPILERFAIVSQSVKGEILSVETDRQGNVWFISDLTLYKYSLATGSITRISQKNHITAFVLSGSNSEIWMSTLDGIILRCAADGRELQRFSVFGKSPSPTDKWIEKLYWKTDGGLIVGTSKQGIKILDTATSHYRDVLQTDFKNESIFVRDILHHHGNEYWFATESGIIIYDFGYKSHLFLTREKGNPWALSDNAVYTLLKDEEGAVWAGTYFGGINYYSNRNNFFEKFYPGTKDNTISGYAVREIVRDNDGFLWIGTEDNGLSKFDPRTNTFQNFVPTGKPGSIAHSNVHGLLVTGDTLWIGTFEHGLDWMNVKTGKVFRHFNAGDKTGTISNNFIFNIIKASSGDVLLATSQGLFVYRSSIKRFELHPHFPDYIFYTTLFEDSEGTIWAGTWRDGLFYYNPSTETSGRLVHETANPESLRSNRINRVYQDSKGNIWVATEGGLSMLSDKNKKRFEHFTTANGLPGNLILSIQEDEEGMLWVSTSRGLVRMDRKNRQMQTFTKANGLLSDQFNYNSSFKDESGKFYFGSVQGLVRFQPAEFRPVAYRMPVFITGIQIGNREVAIGSKNSPLTKSISFTEKLVLKHHQSTFSIDFAALSYVSPAMTQYVYRMEGLDADWNHLKTNRKVYFTNLSPGTYTFRVNAVDEAGNFIGDEARLAVQIFPPFWTSRGAYVLYVVLVSGIIFLLVRNYDKKIKERNRRRMEYIKHQREKSLYQTKIDFFTHVVHEIRTPLTMIRAPLEKLMNLNVQNGEINKNLKLIDKNTSRLISLSGQLLDFRKVESDGFRITFSTVEVRELLQEVYKGFSAVKTKGERLMLQLPEKPVYVETDGEALLKVITNLTDNALKYCTDYVKVELTKTDDECGQIEMRFLNNGPLIPSHLHEKIFEPFYRIKNGSYQQGTGIGLALCRSLSELLNGSLKFSVTDDDLNCFILTVPEKQKANG